MRFMAPSRPIGGAYASSLARDGMRWTRWLRETIAACRGRRSRVVLAPRRWGQAGGLAMSALAGSTRRDPPARVARKPGSPRRARRKPLKPLRGESRIAPVGPVVITRVVFASHTRLRVQSASGFPCALRFVEGPRSQTSGRMCRGNACSCPVAAKPELCRGATQD